MQDSVAVPDSLNMTNVRVAKTISVPVIKPWLGVSFASVYSLTGGLAADSVRGIISFVPRLGFPGLADCGICPRCALIGGYSKRVFDVVLAITALILLSPVMLLVAALIKVANDGPVIFAHPRVGYNGKTFRCLKFRTMVVNGDEVLEHHLVKYPGAALEWRDCRKLRDDPRITPLGRFLRKSSIDELPQLFNVLRGEMSCVGPRPIVTPELKQYQSHISYYLRARPGITGMWQVCGRSTLSYRDRVALDRIYISRWSIWLDITLLLLTIPAVFAFWQAK